MPTVSASDADLIDQLHALVFQDADTETLLKSGFEAALAQFEVPDYTLPFASFNLPIDHFAERLTEEQQGKVGLCRVFILKAGCKMPRPEIHRNSIQRLVSYKGKGAIHSAEPGGVDMNFQACVIESPEPAKASSTGQSWDVVPENTWHYPVAGAEADWFTVTFHSASEAEIVDEYWEPEV